MRQILLLFLFTSLSTLTLGQTATLKGSVVDAGTNESLPFVNVLILGSDKGTVTDIEGNYLIEGITPGVYNIEYSFVGYKSFIQYDVQLSTSRQENFQIKLEQQSQALEEVKVKVIAKAKSIESPISVRSISNQEIIRNPGGNRDISKVIQSLPGVASTVSFRNDIIIRGGAPNENRFYLDGIEVPNINHFATQGSSGGPVGMINVNFISGVDFYSGAFPANRSNALSSIMNFKQKTGNTDRWISSFTLGSSDAGLTFDGPIGKKSSLILSYRRSYLQYLFSALGLPFLPTYNDSQFKYVYQPNKKNKLTFIGLGAIDDFKLNAGVNDGVEDSLTLVANDYILGYLPINTQWNYTVGGKWQNFGEKSIWTTVVSRSHLNNEAYKYLNNDESSEDNKILDYKSQEIENKLRIENSTFRKGFKINFGLNAEQVTYTNSTFSKRAINGSEVTFDFNSRLNLFKHGLFTQISKSFFGERWALSFGLRMDGVNYSETMNNPLNQLSPRLSSSFSFNEKLSFNANIGRYYQLPAYTVLGYRNGSGDLVNKVNDIQWIRADHVVAGFEYSFSKYFDISVESFYKDYANYPFQLADSISLANLGGDFGVIGNEPVTSDNKGRSYGLEFLAQQRAKKGFYGILAYTMVRSEFQDKTGAYIPSAWDNRHIVSLTMGKSFKKNWELGVKFRFSGGSPYTPYDVETTALQAVWDVTQQGVFDYNRLNTIRTPNVHGLDIRIDKKWYLKKTLLNFYFDIQNLYGYAAELQPTLTVQRDAVGEPIADPNNPGSYLLSELPNSSGTLLPSVGLLFEF